MGVLDFSKIGNAGMAGSATGSADAVDRTVSFFTPPSQKDMGDHITDQKAVGKGTTLIAGVLSALSKGS